ncbi:mucin-3A [Bicyclus anynana]|uniref:Mucin-3A n=1 Tax=Bicyclus anynana TaxID=110368 RepID=A0A6J1NJJ4_BICAN|nr:mucin-3A [Bicyclus anynana]
MFAPCLLLLFILGSINADEAPLRCDFNDTLCGWRNDESADVQWNFYNVSVGIYAFFDDDAYRTARLVSPIYDYVLVEDGCFHLECSHDGYDIKLRVYQVPVSIGVNGLLASTEEIKRKYIIHETAYNGNALIPMHLNPVSMFLPGYAEKFQIVIEASASELTFVCLEKYEIFRGKKCVEAANASVTPPPVNRNEDLQTVTTTEPSSTTTEDLSSTTEDLPSTTKDLPSTTEDLPSTTEDLPSTTPLPPTTTTQSATTAATVPMTTAPPPITMVFPAMGQLSWLNGTQPKVIEWTYTYRQYYK